MAGLPWSSKGVSTGAGLNTANVKVLFLDPDEALPANQNKTITLDNLRTTMAVVPYTGANQNVNLGEFGISSGYFQADLSPTTALAEGMMRWNSTDATMDLRMGGNNVTQQIGQESYIYARNNTGSTLLDGKVVKVTGSTGTRTTVALALADSQANARATVGILTEDISNNTEGLVTNFGLVRNLDTSAFVDGDILYLSTSVAGELTNVLPTNGQIVVRVGICVRAHVTMGSILVGVDYEPVSSANNGLSLFGGATQLGHAAAGSGLSNFTANRFMYLAGFNLQIGGTASDSIFTVDGVNGRVVVNKIVGGAGSSSTLTLQPTYGNGASGSDIIINTGNNGSTESSRFYASGNCGIGFSSQSGDQGAKLVVQGSATAAAMFIQGNAARSSSSQQIYSVNRYGQGGGFAIYGDHSFDIGNTSGSGGLRGNANGNITIGSTASISRFAVPIAPTASANYGLVSLGNGAFDGSTAGFYNGNSLGTVLSINTLSGYSGDLCNWQVAGVSQFKVTSGGTTTLNYLSILGNTQTAIFMTNAGAGVTWNNNATIKSPSSGVITIGNEGISDFNRLQFGGTTSSFPALKRSGTELQVKLADDSAYAPIAIGNTVASAVAVASTHKVTINIGGTTYYLLASNV